MKLKRKLDHRSHSHTVLSIPLRRFALFTFGAFAVLTLLGAWIHHSVEKSLKSAYASNLQTILEADINALSIWIDNEKQTVSAWAQDSDLREYVRVLVDISRTAPKAGESLITSPALDGMQRLVDAVMRDNDYIGFGVIDRSGRIVASDQTAYIEKRIAPAFSSMLDRVFRGDVVMVPPHPKDALIADIEPSSDRPVIFTAASIPGSMEEIMAALIFTINPEKDFTRILSVARAGVTGDTYAFNKKGQLISDSRFEAQLKKAGLIPDDPQVHSILNVQIRDPGGNLLKGFRPREPLDQRPLTRMAASAVAGEDGIDIDGYRDFRGVHVIGAWQWLHEYDFGVATEVSAQEAFTPLNTLRGIFRLLFGLLIITTVFGTAAAFFIRHLKIRIREFSTLGQYTLIKKIGSGDHSEVYLARHAFLKRPTAIKLLRPEELSPQTIAQFEREVQTTSRFTHPNTIYIYDYGHTPEGVFYYAMEYLTGIDLARLIELEGSLPPARVIHILKQVCYSLREAHEIGFVHRDIKPPNIILCERGGEYDFVKVLDFGLVKGIADRRSKNITDSYELRGTPAYVAPERFTDSKKADARCDIYSLGAVGFNLLTGQDVFEGTNTLEVCYHVQKTPPPRPSDHIRHPVPEKLDQLIYQCLAKDPDNRPTSVKEIIGVLDSITEAGIWTQADSRQWWKKHSDQIKHHQQGTINDFKRS
jgi:eukaryotic-like serine/threonine-protein kinase